MGREGDRPNRFRRSTQSQGHGPRSFSASGVVFRRADYPNAVRRRTILDKSIFPGFVDREDQFGAAGAHQTRLSKAVCDFLQELPKPAAGKTSRQIRGVYRYEGSVHDKDARNAALASNLDEQSQYDCRVPGCDDDVRTVDRRREAAHLAGEFSRPQCREKEPARTREGQKAKWFWRSAIGRNDRVVEIRRANLRERGVGGRQIVIDTNDPHFMSPVPQLSEQIAILAEVRDVARQKPNSGNKTNIVLHRYRAAAATREVKCVVR